MIIGLTGYAQAGKDSVANSLVQNYGYTRVAFADKIKELLLVFVQVKFVCEHIALDIIST